MLNLFPQTLRNCETSGRRQFLLQIGALGGLGLSLDGLLRLKAAKAETKAGRAGDVNCILIWTRGGTSHHDSLDPKPEARADVRGEFGVIDTALPGVQFTEHMPNFAREAGRFTTMRNLNPQNGSHGTADAIMMSGRKFNPALATPTRGSVVAKELGHRNHLPPFVQVGTNVDKRFGGGLANYLGIAYNAFELPGDPNEKGYTVRDITPPGGISLDRIDRRRQALASIDTLQRNLEKQPDALNAIDDYYKNAFSMISSPATQRAFDLNAESDKTRDAYGRHTLGQSCLLARRMIEAGTRFVTVTSGGWDTHADNFNGLKKLLPPLDQAFPALVADLDQRGLLDSTLVVWMTDFGRTPIINSAAGRDHWSTASILTMAGAGTPAGQVMGKTDDTGERPVDKEYYPKDVAATIFTKLGVPLDKTHTTPDGRPVRICDGEPIPELMG
ncbi:MAG: DUF1501 domain-containing protein [Planctomycetaceae bacterium]|nr:DUF1501 domain-containing protein [Planctomycetaceae bacterium]